jgi:signal transduction histidine kinase
MAVTTFWQRLPFRFKLVGAFFIVIAIGIVSVYLVNVYSIVKQFNLLNSERFKQEAARVAPIMLTFYEQSGDWETFLQELRDRAPNQNQGRRPPQRSDDFSAFFIFDFIRDEELIIANGDGRVIFDAARALNNTQLARPVINQGYPLVTADGETVGILISGFAISRFTPLVENFFRSLNRTTLVAILIAVGTSLILITFLVRQLARPLRSVAEAAEAIAEGDLDQKVNVVSNDEIGHLAAAFNRMSVKLKASEDLRHQMTVDIAHELRTPVTVIKGDMEALVDGIYPPTRETFESILEETHRISRLIDELREITLLDSGELSLEKRDTNLDDLARQMVHAFDPSAESKGISLDYSANGLSPVVQADSDRIAQVLRNLLSNAMRYTPQGGSVNVSLGVQNDQAICMVSDTGPGMTMEQAENVFHRFWRADESRARHSGGSGLGLAISKRLVEAHDGRLWVKSVKGEGSTFGFDLPLDSSPQNYHITPEVIDHQTVE